MKFRDYYETLGVARTATEAEIKSAYRKMARKYHPDVNKEASAEEKFKEIGEAYAVLKDTEKRAAYDRFGANWKNGQDFTPPPDWNEGFEYSDGGFGGAVKIVQLGPHAPMKMIAQVRRQFLTAAEDPRHLHAGRIGRIQKEGEHGWDEVQRRYAMIADQPRNRTRIAMCAGRRDDKARAADQRQEEFPHGYIEGRRCLLKDDVIGIDAILALHP